jgi:hypothetical protein
VLIVGETALDLRETTDMTQIQEIDNRAKPIGEHVSRYTPSSSENGSDS